MEMTMQERLELLRDMNSQLLCHEGGVNSYRYQHMLLVGEYAKIINERNQFGFDPEKLEYIGFAHDLLKDQTIETNASHLDGATEIRVCGFAFPTTPSLYVVSNRHILRRFGLSSYYASDVQSHALGAGIFLHKELGEDDADVLYSVFFHSCPVIGVYTHLSKSEQAMVDTIMLADKLSSSYLKINRKRMAVPVDLDLSVFGSQGTEFNYSTGLVLARLVAQGKHPDITSVESTQYYYNRLRNINPFVPDKCSANLLGGKRKWPERKSMVLPTRFTSLNP